MNDTIKHVLDAIAGMVTVGALLQIIPAVAAVFSIVWLGWQMYDRIKYGPSKNKE